MQGQCIDLPPDTVLAASPPTMADEQSISLRCLWLGHTDCSKSSSKVEWTGALYSCLHAFIHWRHRGAGLKNFIHLCHGSFGSSMQVAQWIRAKIKHAHSFFLTRWLWSKCIRDSLNAQISELPFANLEDWALWPLDPPHKCSFLLGATYFYVKTKWECC